MDCKAVTEQVQKYISQLYDELQAKDQQIMELTLQLKEVKEKYDQEAKKRAQEFFAQWKMLIKQMEEVKEDVLVNNEQRSFEKHFYDLLLCFLCFLLGIVLALVLLK